MINKMKCMLSRLAAQFLKPTLALLAALAVGGAWANYFNEWNGGSGSVSYWDGVNSWVASNSDPNIDDWRIGLSGAQVGFRNSVITSDSAGLFIYGAGGANDTPVEFSAEKDSDGLTKNGVLNVGVWFGGNAALTVKNGTHTFTEINIGRWSNTGVLQLEGGKVTSAGNVYIGYSVAGTLVVGGGILNANGIYGETTGGIILNGGTLAVAEIGPNMTITANGGTIDVGANAVTIAATVTGTGSIIKKGSGTLEFTGDMSGFTGKIIVAEGGAVTVSATGTSATAGVGTAQNGLVFTSTAFAWTGAANDGGKWSTPGNWAIAGVAQTENYPNSESAVVTFLNGATVSLPSEDVTCGKILLASDVAFYGNEAISYSLHNSTPSKTYCTYALITTAIIGSGYKLSLENAALMTDTDNALSIDSDVMVSSKVYFICRNQNIILNGKLTGSGDVVCGISTQTFGVQFYGDNTEFCGTYTEKVATGAARGQTYFPNAKSISSLGSYTLVGNSNGNPGAANNFPATTTYEIGALNGYVYLGGTAYNPTFKIGSRNEDCSFGGTFNRGYRDASHVYYNNVLIKVGTAKLTVSAENIGDVKIQGGTVDLAGGNSKPYSTKAITFESEGATLMSSAGLDLGDVIKGNTIYPVTYYVAEEVNQSWSTTISGSNTAGFTKTGNGSLTLTSAPQYTGTTTVKAGALVLPDDKTSLDGLVLDGGSITANGVTSYGDVSINSGTLNVAKNATIGTLAIAEGATLALTGDGGATITVTSFADGDTTKSRITTPTGTTLSWEGNVGTLVRSAYTYTWTDATGDHAWENRGNWTIPVDGVATVPHYLPSDIDTVYFGATCEVVLSADQPAKNLTVASGARLTLTGSGSYGVKSLQEVPAGGQLVLNGSGLYSYSIPVATSHIDWALNIEVADKTSNWIVPTAAASDQGAGCYVNYGGNLTGTGAILLGKVGDTTRSSVVLSGDNTQFYGTATIQAGTSSRGRITFQSESASSEHARWIVVGHDKNAAAGCGAMNVTGKTMMFGSYEGTCYVFACSSYTGNTLEIGALNTSFTCSLSATANSAANRANNNATLRKVGTGVMTFGNTAGNPCFNAYEMNGGVLLFANADILKSETGSSSYINPSYKFTGGTVSFDPEVCIDTNGDLLDISPYIAGSTSAISVSNDTALVWASQLKSTNTGGLTKKGAGTLTLAAEPQYTGDTAVEAGVLYIVDTYSPTLAAGTVEMASDKTGYKKFVPASAAVAHVDGVYYATFAEAWAAAGNDDNAKWIYLDAALAQDDVVTLTAAWQKVRVANGTNSAEGHIAISGNLVNVALKTSPGADMTEYTAYPTVAVTVTPGTGVASGVIAEGSYISKSGDVYTIYSGSEVTITWTADEGYEFAGGETTATTDISPTENVTPECPTATLIPTGDVTISAPVVGEYGNDFATVTVTAEVTSTYPAATTITYTLKANGTAIATKTAAGDATSVTFDNANVSSLTRYGNISYTVEASGDNVTAAISDATTAMFADTIGWVKENHQTTTTAAAGGEWQTAVTYDSETHKAAVVDNRFSATNCTTGDVVTVTIDDVVYTGLSDLTSADTDAQGAVAVGGNENAPKFMLLTKKNDTVGWYEAAGVAPVLETGVYDIVMTFDYNSNTYKVTVNGTPLTVDGIASDLPLAKAQTSVKDIDFLGAGSLAAINGVQYEGMMAIDQAGNKYATVAEALQANASEKGAVVKLLHGSATTSAEGWNFDSETKTFVKKVIGLIFLAF